MTCTCTEIIVCNQLQPASFTARDHKCSIDLLPYLVQRSSNVFSMASWVKFLLLLHTRTARMDGAAAAHLVSFRRIALDGRSTKVVHTVHHPLSKFLPF